MSWMFGEENGRPIGYGVKAVCDAEGCSETIDRGLGYRCGGEQQLLTGQGCGNFYCPKHRHDHACSKEFPKERTTTDLITKTLDRTNLKLIQGMTDEEFATAIICLVSAVVGGGLLREKAAAILVAQVARMVTMRHSKESPIEKAAADVLEYLDEINPHLTVDERIVTHFKWREGRDAPRAVRLFAQLRACLRKEGP